MKKKILIIAAAICLLIIGVIIPKLTVRDLVPVDQRLKRCVDSAINTHYDNPFERLALYLGKSRIVLALPASVEMESFTIFRIPLGILRGQSTAKLGVFCNLKETELPKTNFDTEAQLSNTNIKFKYPSKGFYNLGINLTNIEPSGNIISGIHTEPTAEFDSNAQSAYVVAEIKLLKNEKNFENIDELADFYKTDESITTFEKEYAKENGHIVDIKDNKYFIYKVTEDATVWHALTITEEGVVGVSLAYTNSSTSYSESVYKNNDELFLEILENISLK